MKKYIKLSEHEKSILFKGVVVGSIITLFVTLIVVTINQDMHLISLKDISKINMFTDIIEKSYYEDIDSEELKTGLFNGVFNALDEYSVYYSPEEYDKLNTSTSEEFCGVGVFYGIDLYTDEYRIISVTKDSPAFKAGLKANDIVKEINGVPLYGMKIDDTSDLVRGEKGTIVTFKVLRGDDLLEVPVVRDDIKVIYSSAWQLTDDIGYISISSFTGDLADDFAKSLDEVKNSKSIILDLRNNTGGEIDIMLDVMKQIVPDGLVATLKYKDGSTESLNLTGGTSPKYKFTVLVNEYSASCSEIMTAYMKENGYATVIGETTFGKGIVQGIREFSDGSAIKLTIASYITSHGVDLGHVGITPDIEVQYKIKSLDTIDDLLSDDVVNRAISILSDCR